MPTRLIREGINSSARVDALSDRAEILYRRLISVADDYGRYYGKAATVRGACWPNSPEKFSDQEVEKLLIECSTGQDPLLILYQVKGCLYLQITNFNQRIRSASKFPDPCAQSADNCRKNADNCRTIVRKVRALGVGEGVCEGGGGGGVEPQNRDPLPFTPELKRNYTPSAETIQRAMSEYAEHGEVNPEWDPRIFLSVIKTPEDEAAYFANTAQYFESRKFRDGFAPAWEKYLTKRQWKHPPQPDRQMSAKRSRIEELMERA